MFNVQCAGILYCCHIGTVFQERVFYLEGQVKVEESQKNRYTEKLALEKCMKIILSNCSLSLLAAIHSVPV